ncbi:MAG TPA: glycosyltransferase family 1 protein [Acidimicrobiales bacterium]|nr:glycosyltransferase family 1 protein [Acidimicrobiales bacterium]
MSPGIALDVQALQVAGWADRGVGRYITGYAEALERRSALVAALLAPELPPPSGLPGDLVAAGRAWWDGAAAVRGILGGGRPVVHHLTAPFLHCEPQAPAGLGVPEHWARSGVPRVVLLHDLIPLRAPGHYLSAAGAEERYRARAEWVGQADLIVTNSDWTGREAVELLGCDPARVVTIGIGVSPFFSPPDGTDDELFRFHLPALVGRPYLVTVAGSDARKGAHRAVATLGRLVERGYDLHLLVVGHLTVGWQDQMRQAAAACGVADRVVLAGAVDDELLRAGYRRALLSVMPSLAEGAGLPVLESAACGTPALTSCTTALAETAADPAAWFDPTDVDSIADAIGTAVDSDARRQRLLEVQRAAAAGATWDAVAERAVAAVDRLAGGAVAGVDRLAERALVTVDRRAGGAVVPDVRLLVVGDQDQADLILELVGSRPGAVDVVGRRGWDDDTPAVFADPAAFGREIRPAAYDAVLYLISPSGGWVEDLAQRHPGWLCWPDGRDPATMRWEPLVRRSAGVIVGSDAMARRVGRELRVGAATPPILVLAGRSLVDGVLGLVEGRYFEPVSGNRPVVSGERPS